MKHVSMPFVFRSRVALFDDDTMQRTSEIAAEGQARSSGHFPGQPQRADCSSGAHSGWDWHHPYGRQQVCTMVVCYLYLFYGQTQANSAVSDAYNPCHQTLVFLMR